MERAKPMVLNAGLFSQILDMIPRNQLAKNVEEGGYDRNYKKFKTWNHLVSMVYCHLSQAKSLPEISISKASPHSRLWIPTQ